ncbi:uncharacterized protein LOC124314096 isoform X1 [Daphnia pulicaria]|uniref:uncharacterized protein LOC124314096 isoform X1 n=2 Tax=Daphnia pulicaria TaxID=35523 RepID=UPI001EEA2BAF|nr:uncharacterized protein LOC124314096 isoform X1 [Daphnia pulicaria]
MGQRNLMALALLALLTIVNAVSIEARANGALVIGGDRIQELHEIQEELKTKFKNFEIMMESEVGKLKEKIALLETKVQGQDVLLQSYKDRQDDSTIPTTNVEIMERSSKKTILEPKTCLEARTSDPSLESGMYFIDPDGQGRGDDPIYVYCNMTTGSTSVLHDSEDAIEVGHCFDPGCYSRQIKYNATLRQITMLSELSNVCQQSIKVDCYDAAFEFNGIPYAWWTDRNGESRYFWAGNNNNASGRYHTCQCGLDGNCKDKSLSCNCDSDLAIELSDVGTLMDKELLPVTALQFGRTIAPTSTNRHTLGRLECSGKVVLNGMPSSCQDLWRIGYTLSGLYSIKGSSSSKVETVYCDFSKLPGDQDLETRIGSNNIVSVPVYFTVGRTTSFSTLNTILSFEKESLNVGDAFNMSTGVFTAPRNGTYFFAFSGFPENGNPLYFNLQLNDENMANCYSPYVATNCNIPFTTKLSSGDRVQLFLQTGSTNSAVFTGWLIAEDIFQS